VPRDLEPVNPHKLKVTDRDFPLQGKGRHESDAQVGFDGFLDRLGSRESCGIRYSRIANIECHNPACDPKTSSSS
jgi:hypothetical protein